ncbi:MAG: LacI family transcriptional regulator [Firmicutes bacterium]|nr:LacI family transcriptional regulator [Bacillota bacterium]MCL5039338.1 LacI family transcriptional regulator [Bacillota bacterium]
MAITIKEVARAAGVSPSTVSRVISGNPAISVETQERVRQIMKELGYFPNAIARSLARKTSLTLGFSISRSAEQAFANPFFAEAIRGAATVAQEKGYHILLSTATDRKAERERILDLSRQRRVDGFILSSSHIHDRLVADLRREGIPFVIIGRPAGPMRGLHWVNNDNVADARKATEHLINLGHQRIGFVSGPRDQVVSLDRQEGYRQAMKERGLQIEARLLVEATFTEEGGYQGTKHLLVQAPEITALLVADDLMATGALRYLEETGRDVPGTISLITFNDTPLAQFARPSLTTVRIPIYQLGAAATRMLVDLIEGRDVPGHELLTAELVIRKSCEAVRGTGMIGEP